MQQPVGKRDMGGHRFQMGGRAPLAPRVVPSHLQYSGVPRANSFFNISLKMLQYFQNVTKR